MTTTQVFCRQPKCVELIDGPSHFEKLPQFEPPSLDCKVAKYSPLGDLFVYTQPGKLVLVSTVTGKLITEIKIDDVFELHFSPLGHYICTWSKPVKDPESGNTLPNVNVFHVDGKVVNHVGGLVNKNQAGWKPQFTQDETLITRMLNPTELQFFALSSSKTLKFDSDKPLYTLNLKEFGKISGFEISPGKNPSVAVFIPENSGKPGQLKVFNIPNFKTPVSQKNFFKAEKCQFKWNSLGTSLLALVSTDVDSSNKSYYGETTLYLMGLAGSFDQRITLDKEGPIHDISWSPTSREFGVIYGYMPAQTSFFDARGNSIFSLPAAPRNTLCYSPHGKFIVVAGFGNLQGTVDVYDRQNKFSKLTSFGAANTSVCQWSPDGRFILTATTSPRLRVDNSVKIWHASGKLCFIKKFKELYAVDWKPQQLDQFPPLKNLEPCPAPHQSVLEEEKSKIARPSTEEKKTGAYRPPHARTVGGLSRTPRENVAPKGIPGATPVNVSPQESKSAAKNRKKRQNKKETSEDEPLASQSTEAGDASLVIGGVQSFEEKKIRSLLKKLRAIESLKQKQAVGDSLEDTQLLKMQTEGKVREELSQLGWTE